MQCRLAIFALYLIEMSEEAGNAGWKRRQDQIWHVVAAWFAWQQERDQMPAWYVFNRGDVGAAIERIGRSNLPGLLPRQSKSLEELQEAETPVEQISPGTQSGYPPSAV
jgi:hypothetical protein